MFINVMQYFKFSMKLSTFYDIINQAFMDVFFFTIMQFAYLMSYALMGYMLFGPADKDFSSLGEATITLFLITIGSKSILDIRTDSHIIRGVYGGSYVIINMLLLNMLVAVYISHYYQYYAEMGSASNIGTIQFLKKFILGIDKDNQYIKNEHTNNPLLKCWYRLRQKMRDYVQEQEKLAEDIYVRPTMKHLKDIGSRNYEYASKDVKRFFDGNPNVDRFSRLMRHEEPITNRHL